MPGLSLADFRGAAQATTGRVLELQKQGGQDRIASSSTLSSRFCNWLRDVGVLRTANPAMVAFKNAVRQEVGNAAIADELLGQLGLTSNHKPLTDRQVARAASYTERVAACKDAPMFAHMGARKFTRYLLSVDKAIERSKVDTHGMTDLEKVGLYGYTSSDYRELNTALREAKKGKPVPAGLQDYIEHARRALARLPDATGPTARGVDFLPAEAEERYERGRIVTEYAFTSSAAGNGFDGRYQFTISGAHGKDVSGFSMFPKEKEVLFEPGTRFKVLDREPRPDPAAPGGAGQIHIILWEV
jgi:hypothetical protein